MSGSSDHFGGSSEDTHGDVVFGTNAHDQRDAFIANCTQFVVGAEI
jgi:hypothetical protein